MRFHPQDKTKGNIADQFRGFPHSSVGKESACNAGDPCLIPGLGRRDRLPTSVFLGFRGGSDIKEFACSAGDLGFNPWVGEIPWRRAWQPTLVFLASRIPMDRGAWQATVHGIAKSRTQLSDRAPHTSGFGLPHWSCSCPFLPRV